MKLALAYLAVLCVAAQPAAAQIERPRLGYVLDSRGDLRPVIGEPASATLGNPASVQPARGNPARDLPGDHAISFACSSKLCVIQTNTAVVAFAPDRPGGGRTAAASRPSALRSAASLSNVAVPCAACSGPALIALDDFGDTPGAWIYFQAARQLARWHNGTLDTAEFAPSGQVLSLRVTAGGFDYAIARGRPGRSAGVIWIEHYSASDGHITAIDSLRSASAVMLFDGGILLSSRNDVILRRVDGQEMTFSLAGPKRLQAAGDGYVEIAVPDGVWLLRTDPGREELFQLPGQAE